MRIEIWDVSTQDVRKRKILPEKYFAVCGEGDHKHCGQHPPSEYALPKRLHIIDVRIVDDLVIVTVEPISWFKTITENV